MKLYKVPGALQWHEWDELWTQLKQDFPVQYFFRHSLMRFIGRYTYRIGRMHWWWLHRFHPSHKYHIIKPRDLEPGYHDPDRRIKYAMFHELCKFAENDLMGTGIDGTKWTQKDFDYYDVEGQESGKDSFYNQFEREKQIIELRNYWVIDRKNQEMVEESFEYYAGIDVPEEWGESWILNSKYNDTPEYQQYRKNSDYIHHLEEQWKEEERRKMHELVDLLPHLWY